MSRTGVIFDIKQFAVFDGPGIRTTVFLKGCPLRCMWCHNPEGLSFGPQLMIASNGCSQCGRCGEACPLGNSSRRIGAQPADCTLCGACVAACPHRLRKICGQVMTSEQLISVVWKDRDYLESQKGGVTFSGGEPAGQPEFLLECLTGLRGMHRAIETSGYCSPDWFEKIVEELDYILMDVKLANDEAHQHYTGVSNRVILENLERLKHSGKPFRIRIPVIPGVNDTKENYEATARLLSGPGCEGLECVELLPYHKTAGAKYEMVNRSYQPEFDVDQAPRMGTDIFLDRGIPCRIM